MEDESKQPTNKRLELIKELARIVSNFSHDKELFHKKVSEVINIESLKENNLVRIEEDVLSEDVRIALRDNKLSEKDLELCYLLEQGFSPSDLTVVLGLKDIRSVYVKQSRIKKKLKGEASPDIILVMLIMSFIAWTVLRVCLKINDIKRWLSVVLYEYISYLYVYQEVKNT